MRGEHSSSRPDAQPSTHRPAHADDERHTAPDNEAPHRLERRVWTGSDEPRADGTEDTANEQSEVSFRDLYDAVGHRSFGPLLLVPAWAGCASRQVPWIE